MVAVLRRERRDVDLVQGEADRGRPLAGAVRGVRLTFQAIVVAGTRSLTPPRSRSRARALGRASSSRT